ncbi:MAG: Hint domain-containing protein [Paracoccus sp. (in: a-proteobacteria)]
MSGEDLITGKAGDDFIDGGDGNDTLEGGYLDSLQGENDTLIGGDGDDSINANVGDDSIIGGSGTDWIQAGLGDDIAYGDNDTIYGNGGSDVLYGNGGDDWVQGGPGSDFISGGDGDDTLLGDASLKAVGDPSDDTIRGGAGNDVVLAGEGDDLITGNVGHDYIDGGAGNDTIEGGYLDPAHPDNDDTLIGGDGDDSINANVGDDSVLGGSGKDWVQAGLGDDTVYGGTENDTVMGNEGSDVLYGEDGDDIVEGGKGTDILSGGGGDDFIDGGNDSDLLTGDDGNDTFIAGTGDTITDFNTATGQNIRDNDQSNNDFVDLSTYYTDANLALVNADRVASGLTPYSNPLQWLRADQDDDGVLNTGGSLNFTILNGGSAVAGSDLTWDNTNVLCFGADARVLTGKGEIEAGYLKVGDLIETRDAGLQAIRWIGRRTLSAAELERSPKLRPIRICAGALGRGVPEADLIVSPQHRMLVRSKIAQKMFGAMEVLVAAKQLCQIEGIDIAEDLDEVTYVHFLFDDHQIVTANGAESESLYTGAEALKSVGPAACEEIFTLFPKLREGTPRPAARILVPGRMGRKMVVRHNQNRKALVS